MRRLRVLGREWVWPRRNVKRERQTKRVNVFSRKIILFLSTPAQRRSITEQLPITVERIHIFAYSSDLAVAAFEDEAIIILVTCAVRQARRHALLHDDDRAVCVKSAKVDFQI